MIIKRGGSKSQVYLEVGMVIDTSLCDQITSDLINYQKIVRIVLTNETSNNQEDRIKDIGEFTDPKLVKKIDIIKEKDKKIDEIIRQHLNEASRDENKIWTRIQDLEDTTWINFIYKAMRTAGIIVITGIATTIMGVLIWMTIRFNQRESRNKTKEKLRMN